MPGGASVAEGWGVTHMNRTAWLTTTLVGSLLSLHAAAAAQDEDDERARSHFQAGASHYEAGDYEDALNEFQRAYEISERPELHYNLSLAHQQLGNLEKAVEHLERYLNEAEDIPNRSNLDRRLTNLRERIAAAEATPAPPPTEGPAPPPDSDVAPVPPPMPAAGGGSTGGSAAPSAESSGPGIPVGAWIGWGVGAAGLLSGAILGGLALADKSDIEGMPCAQNDTCPDSVVNSMETKALVSDILLFGVGTWGSRGGNTALLPHAAGTPTKRHRPTAAGRSRPGWRPTVAGP